MFVNRHTDKPTQVECGTSCCYPSGLGVTDTWNVCTCGAVRVVLYVISGKIRFRSFDSCRESSVSMVVGECSEIRNILISTLFLEQNVFAASIIVGSRVCRWL